MGYPLSLLFGFQRGVESRTRDCASTCRAATGPFDFDFDFDGDDDIVFNDWTANGGDTLWWGPGLSSASSKTTPLAAAVLPFAGDFDGDGRDDLFINKHAAGGDTVWWGTATKAGFSTETGFGTGGATVTGYRYGADGIRTAKTTGAATTTFTYSTGSGLPLLLKETTGSQTTVEMIRFFSGWGLLAELCAEVVWENNT